MSTFITLRITLKSASTFGRGSGVAGLIDRDIEYDQMGLPAIHGRTLKGLLRESAQNLVYSLTQNGQPEWSAIESTLFGMHGRGGVMEEQGILHFGDARLPTDLRTLLEAAQVNQDVRFSAAALIESLTAIRRQTAINPEGGPEQGSLRSMRVLIRTIVLEGEIGLARKLTDVEKGFLAATVLDWRRGGTGRNRGRGWLAAELQDEATTKRWWHLFHTGVTHDRD